ncbi:MAG: gluconokinase [Acidobacteriaceae bacterium]
MVIVVMGVSGSGKTTVGGALAQRLGWAFADADSFHSAENVQKMRRGVPLTDQDRTPWLEALHNAIARWAAAADAGTVLACSALQRSYRDTLRANIDPAQLRFVYLRGSYELFDARLLGRTGHYMPETLLPSQFAALQEPAEDEALILDAGLPVDRIVDQIAEQLPAGR